MDLQMINNPKLDPDSRSLKMAEMIMQKENGKEVFKMLVDLYYGSDQNLVQNHEG